MKIYESVIIVNSSLNEDALNRITKRCENIIRKHGGNLRNTDRWGKRRLAYPIKKFQYGYYIIFDIEAPSELINELEREYRLDEHILRFMTIQKDKKALLAEQKKREEEKVQAEIQEAAKVEEEAVHAEEEVASKELKPGEAEGTETGEELPEQVTEEQAREVETETAAEGESTDEKLSPEQEQQTPDTSEDKPAEKTDT